MNCYVAPSVYPYFEIDIAALEKSLIQYCSDNNFGIYSFARQYIAKGWSIETKGNYIEIAVAIDKASIELKSSVQSLLANFSLLVWVNYPVNTDIHLLTGELDKSYLLQDSTTLEQISAFLA